MQPLVLDNHGILKIFPCQRASKRPACAHSFADGTADPQGINRLWADVWPRNRPALVGVATGITNAITVLDIDPRRGGHEWFDQYRDQLPVTRTHQTRSDGRHLIFNYCPEAANTTDVIHSGIETINDRRYFIWWPAHGCKVLVDAPLSDFPSWLLRGLGGGMGSAGAGEQWQRPADRPVTIVQGEPIPRPNAGLREQRYAEQALSNACFELRFCPVGKRNSKLNVLAYNMGRMIVRDWITRQEVESCLLRACESNRLLADDGLPQCLATIASGLRAGMARPYHDIGPDE